MPEIQVRLIYILDQVHKIRSDIRSAIQYPAIVVLSLLAAFLILLTMVIPKFAAIFLKTGLQLPLPTVICMKLYAILVSYWPVLILLAIGLGIWLVRGWPALRCFRWSTGILRIAVRARAWQAGPRWRTTTVHLA